MIGVKKIWSRIGVNFFLTQVSILNSFTLTSNNTSPLNRGLYYNDRVFCWKIMKKKLSLQVIYRYYIHRLNIIYLLYMIYFHISNFY
jgi:hypothetical protein